MTEDEIHAAYPDLFQKWWDRGYAAAKETISSKEKKDMLRLDHTDCGVARHWKKNFEDLREKYKILVKEKQRNYKALPYKKKYPRMGYHKSKKVVGFCIYCGSKSDTFDHLTPKSRGGSDQPSNIAESCYGCNNEKGNMTYNEYQIWRKYHKPV